MSDTSLLDANELGSLGRKVMIHRAARFVSQVHRYAESAHTFGLRTLDILEQKGADAFLYRGLPDLSQRVDSLMVGEGVEIKNPVILAAGIIKYPEFLPRNIHELNVGAVTVGGITGLPQVGNPGKRLWVFPDAQAAVNCMGLNGPGRVVAAENLAARKARGELPKCPIILNSCNGLASQTEDDKVAEHVANFETFFDLVNIFEVNISCPNQKDAQAMGTNIPLLVNTLKVLQKKNEELARDGKKKKPIWLKIKPDYFQEGGDINTDALKLILQATHRLVDGYTLTNTTTDRSSLKQHGYEDPGKGGLSGALLLSKQLTVTQTVRTLLDEMDGDKVLISTGGIGTGHTASEIIETGRMAVAAGANLAGIYTGLMINGVAVPSLVSAGMQEESRKGMPTEL